MGLVLGTPEELCTAVCNQLLEGRRGFKAGTGEALVDFSWYGARGIFPSKYRCSCRNGVGSELFNLKLIPILLLFSYFSMLRTWLLRSASEHEHENNHETLIISKVARSLPFRRRKKHVYDFSWPNAQLVA